MNSVQHYREAVEREEGGWGGTLNPLAWQPVRAAPAAAAAVEGNEAIDRSHLGHPLPRRSTRCTEVE